MKVIIPSELLLDQNVEEEENLLDTEKKPEVVEELPPKEVNYFTDIVDGGENIE